MAKLTIEIDTDNYEDKDILRLISNRDEIISAIQRLTTIRWKHLESVDDARQEVTDCLDGLYEIFNH
jgi:hypothetical protein